MYIPMFIAWMIKEKDLSVMKRFILPIISIIACAFMVFAAVYAHGITPFKLAQADGKFSFPVLFYLIIFAVIMVAGFFFSPFYRKLRTKKEQPIEEPIETVE